MTKEERHYRNVAALPCAQCGIHKFSQAAHSNRSIDGKARGLKANYLATFPLCCTRVGEVGCHVRHDQYIGITREQASERTERYLASTEAALRALGQWPDTSGVEPVVKVFKAVVKKVRAVDAHAIVKKVVTLEERQQKSREPVSAGRGFPSKKTAINARNGSKYSTAIVAGTKAKENAPSRWPKRKLVSGNKLQSRPFGSR